MHKISAFLVKYDLDKALFILLTFLVLSTPVLWGVDPIYYEQSKFLTISFFSALVIFLAPNILAIGLLVSAAIFNYVNYMNVQVLGLPFYPEQFTAFVTAPAVALEMAGGRTDVSLMLQGLMGVLLFLPLIFFAWKLRPRSKWTYYLVFPLISWMLVTASTSSFEMYRHSNGLAKAISSVYSFFYKNAPPREEASEPTETIHANKILFLIGESESAEAMGVHGSDLKTTPLLSARTDLYVLNDMTAVGSYTKSALDKMMFYETGQEVLNGSTKPSLWQMAAKSGLSTARITSHSLAWGGFFRDNHPSMDYVWDSRMKNNDSPVFFLLDDEEVLEDVVIPYVKEKENYFVTYRIAGSHVPFDSRYPEKFARFKQPYFNSILYTDYVLDRTLNNVDAQWVFWVSDHGVSYENGERISSFIKPPKEIPEEWRQNLEHNRNKPLSQYDLSKTIAFLMGHKLKDLNGVETYNLLTERVPKNRMRYSADMPYGDFRVDIPPGGVPSDTDSFYTDKVRLPPFMAMKKE